MSVNTFGREFRFTTWGESHGPAIVAKVHQNMLAVRHPVWMVAADAPQPVWHRESHIGTIDIHGDELDRRPRPQWYAATEQDREYSSSLGINFDIEDIVLSPAKFILLG